MPPPPFTIVVGVSRKTGLSSVVASSLCKLFDEDYSVSFIARYRAMEIGIEDESKVGVGKQAYDDATLTMARCKVFKDDLRRVGELKTGIDELLSSQSSVSELEAIYNPIKPPPPKSPVALAIDFGLAIPADLLLRGRPCNLSSYVAPSVRDWATVAKVENGVKEILAAGSVKLLAVVDFVQRACADVTNDASTRLVSRLADGVSAEAADNLRVYHDASIALPYVNTYQTSAILRGKQLGILDVSIQLADGYRGKVNVLLRRHLSHVPSPMREAVMEHAWKDKIEPTICENTIRRLRLVAEERNVALFLRNLRQLLLQQPLGNEAVLGVDPGFGYGVKCALVMPDGSVPMTATVFLKVVEESQRRQHVGAIDIEDVYTAVIKILAAAGIGKLFVSIGNGTACRPTEIAFDKLIRHGRFGSQLDVKYCITNESGSSVYSATEGAAEELGGIKLIYRSAVSIARRLQDPMQEMVKIPPHSIGVGQYQHDIPGDVLLAATVQLLEEVVTDVGVDINTANVHLLSRVPGMSPTLAASCVAHRLKNGPFTDREQLRDVDGMDDKAFEQCAGFVTVQKATAGNPKVFNELDMTVVHPESYDIAKSLLSGAPLPSVSPSPSTMAPQESIEAAAKLCGASIARVQLVAKLLAKPTRYDCRQDSFGALFRDGVTSADTLHVGGELTGVVSNVVDFGAFVDVGCGTDALLPPSGLPDWPNCTLNNLLKVGDHIKVSVMDIHRPPKVRAMDIRRPPKRRAPVKIAVKYVEHINK